MSETLVDQRIPILVYQDVEAAFNYLTNVYGLDPGELARAPDGSVVHGELHVGDGQLWLHPESEEFGLKSPLNMGGAATGMVVVVVDNVDAHYRHAVEQGATVKYDPTNQDYGYREYNAVDLEGHLWSFMTQID
jgi:uncharacterized glyoxalase superfamily protein PhnB